MSTHSRAGYVSIMNKAHLSTPQLHVDTDYYSQAYSGLKINLKKSDLGHPHVKTSCKEILCILVSISIRARIRYIVGIQNNVS